MLGAVLLAIALSAPSAPSLSIIVADQPLSELYVGERVYVRAEVGREYALRLHNPYGVSVTVELSVDGLNTLDATEASGRRWVLSPGQTITIPGWQMSLERSRRFYFSTEQDSYSRRLGKSTELGVIRAQFWKERVTVISPHSLTWIPVIGSLTLTSNTNISKLMTDLSASATTQTSAIGTGMGTAHAFPVHEVNLDTPEDAGTIEMRYVAADEFDRLARNDAGLWCPEKGVRP